MVHLRSLFIERDLMREAEERVLESYRREGVSSVIWTVTYACNLRCRHCYEAAGSPLSNELDTEEALNLIKELRELGKPILFISGGEPLLRDDIYIILKESVDAGMRVILSSNGTLIDDTVADKIADTKVHYVALSIYGPEKFHDYFTRILGSFKRTVNALRLLREKSMKIGIKTIVTRENYRHIPYLFYLAKKLGASLVYICDFIPIGRGSNMEKMALSNMEWRRLMDILIEDILLNNGYRDIEIDIGAHPSTAIYALLKLRELGFNVDHAIQRLRLKRENPIGQGFISISPSGDILLSNFLPNIKLGNIREIRIRDAIKNDLYRLLGDSNNLKGICGKCSYRHLCGGCRVKAYYKYADLFEEDPSCIVYR